MELLAPAGNLECALAAFDAGADAVYAGLKKFNARERTENFSIEEMSKLLAYAHGHGKKVYVTFNTLIKENELEEAATELSRLEQLAPDAVIIQDLGIARLARKYFPTLTLHGSTQMGLHNSAGLHFAHELGLTRVILERQTTLQEMEIMLREKPPVELEVFIHGALCCCISGTCLLSSWLGGWSGNRGKCKQPCRRRHRSENGNGFFLSAQDLETLELIPRLMRSGVTSLKIEGRLRRSDYVSNVVAAYQMAINAAEESEQKFRETLSGARAKLAHTLGRKWSLGFYTKESAAQLIKYDAMGVSGLLCGKVVSTDPNGFSVSVGRPFFTGDMIRIQPVSGDEGPAVRITKMSVNGKTTSRAAKGETVFIHADKEIPRGGMVYKIGEKTNDYTARIQALPERKTVLVPTIHISRSCFKVELGGQVWEEPVQLEEAGRHPLSAERILQEFKRIRDERFEMGNSNVCISENPFLPAAVLKELRKKWELDFLANYTDHPEQRLQKQAETLEQFREEHKNLRTQCDSGNHFPNTALVPRGKHPKLPENCRIARMIDADPAPGEELILPFYIHETGLKQVREAIHHYYNKGGRTIRLTSPGHIPLVREYPDLILKTGMPLPVCNSMAAAELKEHGVRLIQASLELGGTELKELIRCSPLPVEQYCFGRPVLLSTRAELPVKGKMTDAKGDGFRIRKQGILTQVLPEKVMSVPPLKEASARFYDYTDAENGEKNISRFNYDITLA
ncbi:MAG: U32 family peptidase [Lentisphaeria bacterium]|nr:U32 family peptidase [Lentisphaeria bacterium]